MNEALGYIICKQYLPLSFSESKGFIVFAKKAVPLWQPPGRSKVTRLVATRYDLVSTKLKDIIKNVATVSMAFDYWTEEHTKTSYLGATVHYLEDNKMQSAVLNLLEMDKAHTIGNIVEQLDVICQMWGISLDKISQVATDNAPNIRAAVKEYFGPGKTVACFDHTLNLVAQHCVDRKIVTNSVTKKQEKVDYVEEVPALMDKVKEIVQFINKSGPASLALKNKQMDDGKSQGTALSMVQSMPTRWSSTYLMIERFLEVSQILGSVLLDFPKMTMLTGAELMTLRGILDVLKPMYLANTGDVS